VTVSTIGAPSAAQARRVGFTAGQVEVPDDFDRMGQAEIERLFLGDSA